MSSTVTERARILGSRAFRRLSGKTQVIHAPTNDHVATRLTHTLEVASVARELACGLDPGSDGGRASEPLLDHALVEAIALAHDVGHPPFGHAGEAVLARLAADAGLGGFHHAAFGVRLLSVLERDSSGAPVVQSKAVLEGIVAHSKGKAGAVFVSAPRAAPEFGDNIGLRRRSTEALLVRAADLYAYASGDLDDAYRLGVFTKAAVPETARKVLGDDGSSVRRVLIDRTIRATLAAPERGIHLDDEADSALAALRAFLYERFYEGPATRSQTRLAGEVLTTAWNKCLRDLDRMLEAIGWRTHMHEPHTPAARTPRDALDAIACMTDRFAVAFAT
jgi:dGTPase